MPKTGSAKKQLQHKNIAITITKDGKLFVKKQASTLDAFKSQLKSFDANDTFLINCDKNTSFNSFVEVLDILKSNNFNNIALVRKSNE